MTALLTVAFILAAPVPADPTVPQEARELVSKLGDPDPKVRNEAATQLRLLVRRVDKAGGQRIQRGEEFEPKVKGLVPFLIRAANDEDESVRCTALHALADALDPAGVAAIRERLKDKSENVRLLAACLLTDYKDASGLEEMKKALVRFRAKPDPAGMFEVERLLASFERVTGKGFGVIPMNPNLASDLKVAAASEKRYAELLDTWAAWWDWQPK